MLKIIRIFILLISLSANADKDVIYNVGVLDYKPFSYFNQGKYMGYAVSLWEMLAKEEGIKFKYVNMGKNINTALENLKKEQIDFLVGPVSITSNRVKEFIFSTPYLINYVGAVSKFKEASFISFFSEVELNHFGQIFKIFLIGFCISIILLVLYNVFYKKRTTLFQHIYKLFYTSFESSPLYAKTDSIFLAFITIMWSFFSLLIFSALTGIFTSEYTNHLLKSDNQVHKPLHVIRNENIGVIEGTSTINSIYFYGIEPEKIKTYESTEAMIKALNKGEIQNFFVDLSVFDGHHSKNTEDFKTIKNTMETDFISFVTNTKHKNILKHMDSYLLKLRFKGILSEFCRQNFTNQELFCKR